MSPALLKLLKPDVIVEMLEIAVQYEKWDKLKAGAEQLYNCAQYIYEERLYSKAKELPLPAVDTARPLVYYFGFSHYRRGLACLKLGLYEQARESIVKYAELGWLQDLDSEGLQIVEDFRNLAKSSAYALDLFSGRLELLREYAAFLQEQPEELLPGLAAVLQAAVQHEIDIDDRIHNLIERADAFQEYWNAAKASQYCDYCYHMALYRQQNGRGEEAAEYALKAMKLTLPLDNTIRFNKCMALFESLRRKATKEQSRQYRDIRSQYFKRINELLAMEAAGS